VESLTDNALMIKVKSGELEKLGLLYERYKKRLFGFFYQINKDASLSEDLVQNVFVRVMKYRSTYKEDSHFITWLFKIARNVNYDHFRKSGQKKHLSLNDVYDVPSTAASADDQINTVEYSDLLEKALLKLPVEKREILVLSKYKELKYKEIGEIINCSEVAARTKAHRAMAELRKVFLELDK